MNIDKLSKEIRKISEPSAPLEHDFSGRKNGFKTHFCLGGRDLLLTIVSMEQEKKS